MSSVDEDVKETHNKEDHAKSKDTKINKTIKVNKTTKDAYLLKDFQLKERLFVNNFRSYITLKETRLHV